MTSIVVTIMETLLKLNDHLKTNNFLGPKQHGFTEGRSCQTNLTDFQRVLDEGDAVDIAYLEFSKVISDSFEMSSARQ